MNDKFWENMSLPLSSTNEDIETISSNLFKPLFDVSKFEIRAETVRDKGIDFHIEIKIKQNNNHIAYTNFRFAIQLKATDSIETNQDGSISLPLHTSNIHYLLNNPMPAFYVLYYRKTNTFYFESIKEFAKKLYEKDKNWNEQSTHKLRFNKILDAAGLEEMYQTTLQRGRYQRIIKEKEIILSSTRQKGDKIIIDENFNVRSDAETRSLIEEFGIELLNRGKWKEILFIHKNASGNIASTALYNLVIGLANYYTGNLIDSLSFFRTSYKLKNELPTQLQNYLFFFEAKIKYSIGIITDEDYNRKMLAIEQVDDIGIYVQLEKARNNYLKDFLNDPNGTYNRYIQFIQEVISNPKTSENIKRNAQCELILIEGCQNNMNYVIQVAKVNALEDLLGVNIQARKKAVLDIEEARQRWLLNVQNIQKEAYESKDYFVYFNSICHGVRVQYELQVFGDTVFFVKGHKYESVDKKILCNKWLDLLAEANNYFSQIGHIENTIVALSIKYQIFHYLKDFENAHQLINNIENIIDTYDLNREKFEVLKNGGSAHEKSAVFFNNIFDNSQSIVEWEEYIREMQWMDEKEKQITDKVIKGSYQITLFPIGDFRFPEHKKAIVYEILNINDNTQPNFDRMFEKVIPIANIYHNPILEEGYKDGHGGDKGMESSRNIYRIRKAFYENNFYRIENHQY